MPSLMPGAACFGHFRTFPDISNISKPIRGMSFVPASFRPYVFRRPGVWGTGAKEECPDTLRHPGYYEKTF